MAPHVAQLVGIADRCNRAQEVGLELLMPCRHSHATTVRARLAQLSQLMRLRWVFEGCWGRSGSLFKGCRSETACSEDQPFFWARIAVESVGMYLRFARRIKDGKEHRYWNIVESKRCAGGKVVQRQVLYLGEINDSQREAWCRVIEAFDEDSRRSRQLALFPAERAMPEHAKAHGVQVRLGAMELHRPRQWGACWLACQLYEQLELDRFWARRLPASREGTAWHHILQTLVCYRLIDPGSEWRLHRQWFEQSAMADLLGGIMRWSEKNALYRCLDKLLAHKDDLFCASAPALAGPVWRAVRCAAVRPDEHLFRVSRRRTTRRTSAGYGYSRDKRGDCVQVVIALIVTPEGFPLAYEVLPGNTADNTTLRAFLRKIEAQYGKADRIWVMDRGIPTEEVLAEMRQADPPVCYLVGTPKGRLGKLEELARAALAGGARGRGRKAAAAGAGTLRPGPEPRAHSQGTRHAPAQAQVAMGAAQADLRHGPEREELLMKLGAARAKSPAAWRLVDIEVARRGAASASSSIAQSSARCGGAKVAICCVPICVGGTRPSCGSSTSSSSRSRRPSRH